MLLSLITFLPLLFALALLLMPNEFCVRTLALLCSLVQFGLGILILSQFDKSSAALQLSVELPWVPELGIHYLLAVDGISLWLVLLTTFLLPFVILGSWTHIADRLKGFHASLFVLQGAMIGSFLSMDAILFYTFFELSLIPMYFLIGIWGGKDRVFATLKFFIFTMLGSLLMLAAIIYLMFAARDTLGNMTSNLLAFYNLKIPFVAGELMNPQTLLFLAFTAAFAIKAPLFPLHTWFPDAYNEAPAPVTALLSGVMAKMGAYGFLRFVIPLFPEAAEYYSWVFLFLGTIGIVYGALIALIQPSMKRLVAYSSFSHMGYIMMGLFALNTYGVSGSLFQMISHGVTTGALFLLIGLFAERFHTLEIGRLQGLAANIPVFAIFFFVLTIANIAVPGTNGFVGEFLILLGTFAKNKAFAAVAVTGVIFGAAYMLWMYKRVFFGAIQSSVESTRDLSFREIVVLTPFVVLIFWMGVFPNHFLDYSKASIEHFVDSKDNYQLEMRGPTAEVAK